MWLFEILQYFSFCAPRNTGFEQQRNDDHLNYEVNEYIKNIINECIKIGNNTHRLYVQR